MKKTIKFLFAILLSIGIISCSSDDDNGGRGKYHYIDSSKDISLLNAENISCFDDLKMSEAKAGKDIALNPGSTPGKDLMIQMTAEQKSFSWHFNGRVYNFRPLDKNRNYFEENSGDMEISGNSIVLTSDKGGAVRKLEDVVIKGDIQIISGSYSGKNLTFSYKEWSNEYGTYLYFVFKGNYNYN